MSHMLMSSAVIIYEINLNMHANCKDPDQTAPNGAV